MNKLSNQDIIEGGDLSVNCTATPGNPGSTSFYWTKIDNPRIRQNGSTLQLYKIQRNNTGTYRCTAENTYYNQESGTHNQTMVINVLCMYSVHNYIIQNAITVRLSDRMQRNIVTGYIINN